MYSKLSKQLEDLKSEHRYRELKVRSYKIDFFSNDYLGLIYDPLRVSDISEFKKLTGSSGSRLISGNSELFEETENLISEFHKVESALIYSTGYQANIGLISAVTSRHDTILYDNLIHASLRDGIKLSDAKAYSFKHNDLEDLESKLKKTETNKIIIIESRYSMDGDTAPLKEILNLSEKYNAHLIVDEAHSVGVDGEKGEGIVCKLGLQEKVFATIVTFGKALGCHGAAILSNTIIRNYLINFSRSFIYSTGMSPQSVWDIKTAYEHLPNLEARRNELISLSKYLSFKLPDSLSPSESFSPIHRFIVPGNEQVLKFSDYLNKKDIGIVAVRASTVPKGKERIRICLHSYNTREQIDFLVSCINEAD